MRDKNQGDDGNLVVPASAFYQTRECPPSILWYSSDATKRDRRRERERKKNDEQVDRVQIKDGGKKKGRHGGSIGGSRYTLGTLILGIRTRAEK